MTTPLTQMPKPDSEQYKDRRKLFLVPIYAFSADAPEDGQKILERYWTEVRDHVNNLERSLGRASHVYHEALYLEGAEGLKMLEGLNPKGCSFIQAVCSSEASLEATEDRAFLEESTDWQRCISIGLASEKVMSASMEGYQQATKGRYDHIATRIDETLKEGEAGALFIREDHRVQFPSDIQVFYVAPPALDALKRWINDQVRSATESIQRAQQEEQRHQGEQADRGEQEKQEKREETDA